MDSSEHAAMTNPSAIYVCRMAQEIVERSGELQNRERYRWKKEGWEREGIESSVLRLKSARVQNTKIQLQTNKLGTSYASRCISSFVSLS